MTIRRLGDIAAASALLLICLPMLVLAAMAVAVASTRPPFYRVERIRRDGQIVRLWRLRTARDTVFGPKLTAAGTFLHRYHLDQIPQLLNVVTGEMSLLVAGDAASLLRRKVFAVRGP